MQPCCHWPLGGLTCKLPSLYHPHFSQGGNSCYPVLCPGQAVLSNHCSLPGTRCAWCAPSCPIPAQHGPFHTCLCTADKLMGIWGDLRFISPGWVPEQQVAVLGEHEGGSWLCVSSGGCSCCSLYRKHLEILKLEPCATPRKTSRSTE